MNAEQIIAALESRRVAKGITYYRIAKDAGMSAIGVERILTGKRQATLPTVCAIAEAIGISLVAKSGRTKTN